MSEKVLRLRKGSPDDWPSLALLEFTDALAKAMKAKGMKQKDLAEKLGVSPPYISSIMSCNENLTVEQMSRLAEAAGGSLHLTVAPPGLFVRWVEDTLGEPATSESEIRPSPHRYEAALNMPREYSLFAPRLEVPGLGRSIERRVLRPPQPPFSLSYSRSPKPLTLRRQPINLLDQRERRHQ